MAESVEEYMRRTGMLGQKAPSRRQSVNEYMISTGMIEPTNVAVDTSTPVQPSATGITEIRQQQNIETGYQQALRDEQARIASEANMSMEPETIREQAVSNLAPLWAGRTAGFDSEPTTFRAPAIEVATPEEPTLFEWEEGLLPELGTALRPQARVGEARAARTEGINEAVLPSVRRYETMRGLFSPEQYGEQEGVSRQDKTEYIGFRSAVGQYVEDNPNTSLQAAIDTVRNQLEELPALMAGELDEDRYYTGANEGELGPNDPWVRAFNRQRTEGDLVPRLSDYQKEYLNRALEARQEEFYPDVFESVDEEIPDYEVLGEEEYGEVEGGLTEEDLDYHIDRQREDLMRDLEREHGLDPLPFWTGDNTEYVMSNMEELSEGWLWQKQYPDGATVEGPVSWLVRSAFLIPNMGGTAIYEGITSIGAPGMSREEIAESEAARMAETPLYEGHPYLRNIATGQSLTNDAYALYHYGPAAVQKWAPLAGAVGFAGEVLLVPFDAGLGSAAKGAMAGYRTYQAQKAAGIGARFTDAMSAGLARTGRDLAEQAPGLGWAGRQLRTGIPGAVHAGDPTILLASQTADYLESAQHINSWRRLNPTATGDEILVEIEKQAGSNSRLLDEARVKLRDTGEIPVFNHKDANEIDIFSRQLDEVAEGRSNNIPRRRELIRALNEEGYGKSLTMRSTTDEFVEAIKEVGAAKLRRRMIWDVASDTAVRALGKASVGRDLRLLTPRVAVEEAQVGTIINTVKNNKTYQRLMSFGQRFKSNLTFQDLPLHKNPVGSQVRYAEETRQGIRIHGEDIKFVLDKAREMVRAGMISNHAYMKIIEELKPAVIFGRFGKGTRGAAKGGQLSLDSIRTLQTAMMEQVALSKRMGIATKAWDDATDATKTRLLTPINARNMWVMPDFFRDIGKKLKDMLSISDTTRRAAPKMKSIVIEHAINTYRQSLHSMDANLRTMLKKMKNDPAMREAYGLADDASHDDIMMALTFGPVANRGQHTWKILEDIIDVSLLQEEVTLRFMNALDNAKFQRPRLRFTEAGFTERKRIVEEYYRRILSADTKDLNGIVRQFFGEITGAAFAKNRTNFVQTGKLKDLQALKTGDYADVMSGIYYKAEAARLSDNVLQTIADELPAARIYANSYDELGRTVQRHLWENEKGTSAIDTQVQGRWVGRETIEESQIDVDNALLGDEEILLRRPEALSLRAPQRSLADFNGMIKNRLQRLFDGSTDGISWEEAVVRDMFGDTLGDKAKTQIIDILNDTSNANGQTLFDIIESLDDVARQMLRANSWDKGKTVDDLMGKLEGLTATARTEEAWTLGADATSGLPMQREMQRLVLGEDASEAVDVALRSGKKLQNVENNLIKLFEIDSTLAYDIVQGINKALDMATSLRYNMMLGLRLPFHVKNNITAPAIIWGSLGGADAAQAIRNYPKALRVFNEGRFGTGRAIVTDRAGRVWTSNELYDMAISSGALRSQSSVILSASNMDHMMKQAKMTPQAQNRFREIVRQVQKEGGDFFKMFQDLTEYEDQVWRLSTMITAIKRGDDPITAMNAARLSLMDYQNMSQIERTISAKFMMFYAFTRANAALFLQNVFNNPKRLFNMYRATQMPGLLLDRVDPVKAQFYLPDYTIPKVLIKWVEDVDGGSYYQTFGEVPILEAMTMFAQMGLDLADGNVREALTAISDKIDPTYRSLLDMKPVFEYKSNHVDERDMYGLPNAFWDVIVGERPEPHEPYPGQGTYEGSVWKLSEEGMERYVEWKEHVFPFFALQTYSNDWVPMWHNTIGRLLPTQIEGRRTGWGNVLGVPINVGTIPTQQMRENVQRDILEQTED